MDHVKLEELLCSKAGFIKQQLWIIGVDGSEKDLLYSDIMETALKSLHQLKEPDKIESWLKTIIIRRLSKHSKRPFRRREVSNIMTLETGEEVDVYELVSEVKSAEEMFIEAEKRKVARKLLETLPKEKKRIIQMRIWGEYKFSEIAAMTNHKESTIKSTFRRSLIELRRTYDAEYGKEGLYDR